MRAATVPRSLRCGGPFQAPEPRSGHPLHGPLHPASACSRSACSVVPVAGAIAADAARSLPTVAESGPARRLGAAAARAAAEAQGADARPAGRADRGRGSSACRIATAAARRAGSTAPGSSPTSTASSGSALPHNAAAQYSYGRAVDRGHLKPGDLVFFHGLGHVGLYIGHGRMIHAPQSGERVEIQSLAVAQRQRRGRPPPHPQPERRRPAAPSRRVVFGP